MRKKDETSGLDYALVHIRFRDIVLDLHPKLVSRGMHDNNVPHDLTIKLIYYYDNAIITMNLVKQDKLKMATISQLKYSSQCEGEIIITGKVSLEPFTEIFTGIF